MIAALIAVLLVIVLAAVVVVGAIALALISLLGAFVVAAVDVRRARQSGQQLSYRAAFSARLAALWKLTTDQSQRKGVFIGCAVAGLVVAIAYGLLSSGHSAKTTAAVTPPQVTSTPSSTRTSSTTQPASRHHPSRNVPPTHHRVATHSGGGVCMAPCNVLEGVYHPERLQVLSPCRIAAGTVIWLHHEPDGDLHIDVAVEAAYGGLMNEVNRSGQKGALLAEFMPRDGGHLPPPSVGDHVRLTGAWVNDADHGWNEFHPVWSVQINGGPISRSGPQYGGSPSYDRSSDAAEGCRTREGGACRGYAEATVETYKGEGNGTKREGTSSSGSSGSSSTGSSESTVAFCTTHRCISSFAEGTGTIVQCADGEWSHSGGRPGVCSRHGGPKE